MIKKSVFKLLSFQKRINPGWEIETLQYSLENSRKRRLNNTMDGGGYGQKLETNKNATGSTVYNGIPCTRYYKIF